MAFLKKFSLYLTLSTTLIKADALGGDFGFPAEPLTGRSESSRPRVALPSDALAAACSDVSTKAAPNLMVIPELSSVIVDLNNYGLKRSLKNDLVKHIQGLFPKILSGDLIGAFNSWEHYYAWLKVRSLRNTALHQESIDLGGGEAAEDLGAYEYLDHVFISGLLGYLDALTDESQRKKADLTLRFMGSNNTQGKLIVLDAEWSKYFPSYPAPKAPSIGYYQDTTQTEQLLYRLYLCENKGKGYNGVKILANSPTVSAYQFGEMTILGSAALVVKDGFILDKTGRLLTQKGVAIIAEDGRTEQLTAYKYQFDEDLGRMAFTSLNARSLEEIIAYAGGIEQLRHEKLIFIPENEYTLESGLRIGTEDAELLLPFFHVLMANETAADLYPLIRNFIELMQRSYEPEETMQEKVSYLKRLTRNIVTAPYSVSGSLDKPGYEEDAEDKAKLALGDQVAGISVSDVTEISSNDVKVLTEEADLKEVYTSEDVVDAMPAAAAAAASSPTEPQLPNVSSSLSVKRKYTKQTKQSNAAALASAAPAKADDMLEEPATTIDRIELETLEKIGNLRHLSTNAAKELLENMVADLRAVLKPTGESRTRGSHGASMVALSSMDAETALGIARRPQKFGFNAGTMRTVVKKFTKKIREMLPAGGAGAGND